LFVVAGAVVVMPNDGDVEMVSGDVGVSTELGREDATGPEIDSTYELGVGELDKAVKIPIALEPVLVELKIDCEDSLYTIVDTYTIGGEFVKGMKVPLEVVLPRFGVLEGPATGIEELCNEVKLPIPLGVEITELDAGPEIFDP